VRKRRGEKAEVRFCGSRSRWDEWEEWRSPTATSLVFIELLRCSVLSLPCHPRGLEGRQERQRKSSRHMPVEEGRCKRSKPEREPAARQSGFGWLVLVSHYRGGHKGSRRILILVSPNLLTYLAYPGNSRRIHPAPWDNSILESSSLQRDNLWSPLFASLSLCSPPFFPFFPSSRLWGLPFLARRFFPVFSGAALR